MSEQHVMSPVDPHALTAVREPQAACAGLIEALCGSDADHLSPLPGITMVAAHPDDETVGAGSRLPRLRQAHFVYVTDGAPADGQDAARHGLSPESYAGVRQRELQAALALAGIRIDQVWNLRCPDQQAALHLVRLAESLAEFFELWGTRAVITHPYEGGHPDHDATAFAVHAAGALMHSPRQAPPGIVEMTSYHMGSVGIRTCAFLPDANADAGGGALTVQLTPEEARHKRALLGCYVTQQDMLGHFPVRLERFRPAPRYDFLRPPHAGELFYEGHAWGFTGQRFCTLAARAMADLGLKGAL